MSPFHSGYAAALAEYIEQPDERRLRVGYELGRVAVASEISSLELVAVHHRALAALIDRTRDRRTRDIVEAASTFLQELLSAYEMAHRIYREAAASAALERRQTEMLRQLSAFLADTSLSAGHPDALEEVIRLVAEHAREFVDAAHSIVTCTINGERIRAASDHDQPEPKRERLVHHVESIASALPPRVARAEWTHVPLLRSIAEAGETPISALTLPIVALDDRVLGTLQLLDKRGGDFTKTDEALALHLADITASAIERAQLYYRAGTA